MSKEIARTPLIVKLISLLLFLIGLTLLYLVVSSTELPNLHKIIGYSISLLLIVVPGFILLANVVD